MHIHLCTSWKRARQSVHIEWVEKGDDVVDFEDKMTKSRAMGGQAEHAELLQSLLGKLRVRNAEQTLAFKDVFKSHQGLLTLNEMLRQQTLDQDKVDACTDK